MNCLVFLQLPSKIVGGVPFKLLFIDGASTLICGRGFGWLSPLPPPGFPPPPGGPSEGSLYRPSRGYSWLRVPDAGLLPLGTALSPPYLPTPPPASMNRCIQYTLPPPSVATPFVVILIALAMAALIERVLLNLSAKLW